MKALIFDTATYKYPAHWVPVADLFAAMNTVDGASGKDGPDHVGSLPLLMGGAQPIAATPISHPDATPEREPPKIEVQRLVVSIGRGAA